MKPRSVSFTRSRVKGSNIRFWTWFYGIFIHAGASQMQPVRRAVIDVGTNSVKLLVADLAGQTVHPVWEEGNQTRLGEGFYKEHVLQPAAIQRTAKAVRDFAAKAREHRSESIRLIATSAARDARNPQDLVAAIRESSGMGIEIISGDQEAEWAYLGVTTDPAFANQSLLIMEVGGGSTQFILGDSGHRRFQKSFKVGAVRLLESCLPSDPPLPSELKNCREWLRRFIDEQVKPQLGETASGGLADTLLVGTGGTAAILARMEIGLESYDRGPIEQVRLAKDAFTKWVLRLWSTNLAERRRIPGLPPPRADVILTGAAIYEAAVLHLGFSEFRVSTRGLRFAALLAGSPEPALT